MKIAFVGKGGSGKTTLSSLFTRSLDDQKTNVLAIDADINQHMAQALGADEALAGSIPALGLDMIRVKDYLRGINARIKSSKSMIKTTPPGTGSRLLKISQPNPLFDHFARKISNITFMATGALSEEDLGLKCYHSKLGATELILSHLIDQPNEYVVVDMTAGADSFAGGMFMKFDVTFLITEPTLKGVSVYHQYKEYGKEHNINLKVIGNKVENSDDVAFLRKHAGDDLLATFSHSQYVRALEKGEHLALAELEPKNQAVLQVIKMEADKVVKDWDVFYRQQVNLHIKTSESWANHEAGEDLTLQIDPDFSLSEAAKI
ncbi:MAG: ATP-binding protein [Candidatus Saccharibacteria bacterium]|jgi:CO dehydrogenase maturation factor|nr:ATP-binding protein [Candidatus Saccharibacteria bacterium]